MAGGGPSASTAAHSACASALIRLPMRCVCLIFSSMFMVLVGCHGGQFDQSSLGSPARALVESYSNPILLHQVSTNFVADSCAQVAHPVARHAFGYHGEIPSGNIRESGKSPFSRFSSLWSVLSICHSGLKWTREFRSVIRLSAFWYGCAPRSKGFFAAAMRETWNFARSDARSSFAGPCQSSLNAPIAAGSMPLQRLDIAVSDELARSSIISLTKASMNATESRTALVETAFNAIDVLPVPAHSSSILAHSDAARFADQRLIPDR